MNIILITFIGFFIFILLICYHGFARPIKKLAYWHFISTGILGGLIIFVISIVYFKAFGITMNLKYILILISSYISISLIYLRLGVTMTKKRFFENYEFYSHARKVSPNSIGHYHAIALNRDKIIFFRGKKHKTVQTYCFQEVDLSYRWGLIPNGIKLKKDNIVFEVPFPKVWKEEIEKLYYEKINNTN